jgi:hypothetical protein
MAERMLERGATTAKKIFILSEKIGQLHSGISFFSRN